ncbi:tetratricopeptide repeat protein [Pseudoflavitalea sp. G-6-1-2]|uniref:tetratricopeptide repeat protein n=1 Tax=Pseudoflavitalea sp. G-6-1-2 TaxID=2728841 RepID=UPI00146E72E7|nr:tetratricopeptide repeat protein [Pseudoflavitalea sp. G-6-1-2]NML21213.1 tetratricopeptide repeat protein [Pseudoflavitalea sp. G-6-1-2]
MKQHYFRWTGCSLLVATLLMTNCKSDPKSPAAIAKLTDTAFVKLMEGNLDAAQETAASVINADSSNGLAYLLRASNLLFEKGDLSLAQADLEKAVQLSPNNGVCHAFLAECYRKQSNATAAKQSADKAISLLQSPATAMDHFALGLAHTIAEKPEAAIADYRNAIALNPRYAGAYLKKGALFYGQNQNDSAFADLSKAIEINDGFEEAYMMRGNILFAQQQFDAAAQDYSKTIALDPKSPTGYLYRGNIYAKQKQYEQAATDLTKAIELSPDNMDAYIERANAYYYNKQYDDALSDYKKIVEMSPDFANGWLYVGIVQHEKQQYNEAIASYTKAIDLDSANLYAYANRADALDAIGEKKNANRDRKIYADLGGEITASGESTTRSIFPGSTFDASEARAALERGSSTIRGRACTKVDGRIFDAQGVKVVLFPVTAYLEEWYDLRRKKEGRKTNVYMSTEANQYRIETSCDYDGRFAFEGLKPGRYFIQIIHNFNQMKTARIYTGSDTYWNGPVRTTTNYYYDQNYVVARSKRLEKWVEIKEDGDTKKVTLANGLIKSCVF